MDRMLDLYPLAQTWGRPSLFTETVAIGTTSINLCGLATSATETVTGSAAELGVDAVERAYFELIERTSILEAIADPSRVLRVLDRSGNAARARQSERVFPRAASEHFSYARSNGVAAASDWGSACDAARWELLERDRVLRSWYGEACPRQVELPRLPQMEGLLEEYAFSGYLFPSSEPGNDTVVAGVFAFPRRVSNPFVYGFGGHSRQERSIEKAERECVQRLGFLWGEALPLCEPQFATNAEYHQDFYLQPSMQARLRAWLFGEHVSERCRIRDLGRHLSERLYVDLTPDHLRERVFVVKALPGAELELTFGRGHPAVESPLRERFQVHPLA